MEKSNKIQRSGVWEQIYKVVKTLPRDQAECDAPDTPSVASELEELFLKLLPAHDVSVSLPTRDEVVSEGYRIAKDAGYNYRRVLKDLDHDIYYSGWMDCYDWILKGNER